LLLRAVLPSDIDRDMIKLWDTIRLNNRSLTCSRPTRSEMLTAATKTKYPEGDAITQMFDGVTQILGEDMPSRCAFGRVGLDACGNTRRDEAARQTAARR
jgi:hypothetical protein